ncbi:alpha/beta-Hydrolases superfamily protein [Striga asiatica]|uniref:Alpha/beta-Hydrolases superfamily protein n=1 Tax=Striga asiatica TaxID=4170 RepID=A0A5A7R206_STRAF|nr:alpha/beta-Hydrolases superfamily protein [Striga asiatica]
MLISLHIMPTNLSIQKSNRFSNSQGLACSLSRNRSIKLQTIRAISQIPAMQQKITILNNRGEKLVGVLHESGSSKIVVLCHGFRSSKENNTLVNLTAALENEGISVFRFDFSGNGESEGSFMYGNYSSEVEDLRAVIEYFKKVNRLTVAAIGHSKGISNLCIINWTNIHQEIKVATVEELVVSGPSTVRMGITELVVSGPSTVRMGGNVVLLYASKYHDIGAVVNVSGRCDLERGIKERLGKDYLERLEKDGFIEVKTKAGDYKVTEESMRERLSTSMHDVCHSIDVGCRVFTVHGSLDEIVPVGDAIEFSKIIPNHQLQIIDGADHRFSSHEHELASAVFHFVKGCF